MTWHRLWLCALAFGLAFGAQESRGAAGDENAPQNFFRDDYAVDVDPFSGTFSTRIDIEVPGFRGIEPKLALTYSSSGRNGFPGVGWSLSGLSYIERISPGKGSPSYTATDTFMLDGAELVPCTALGGTHCTRIQSFQQIRQVGANWQVREKNGVLSTYTPLLTVPSFTFRWALKTVVDPRGNTVTYNYSTPCGAGSDCYPTSITYNGTTITFTRAARTDTWTFADGRGVRLVNQRLTGIDVMVGAERARRYALNYTASTDSGRSLLTSVERYGTDNTTKYPDIVIAYENGAEGTFEEPVDANLAIFVGSQVLTGDYNADGRTDVFVVPPAGTSYRAWLSDGTGEYTSVASSPPAGHPAPSNGSWFGGDINGDGSSDVLFAGADGKLWIWYSTGDGTFEIDFVTGSLPGLPLAHVGFWTAGDFDGDGKTDLAHAPNITTLYIYHSDGDWSFDVTAVTPALGQLHLGLWLPGDLNGDGNADLIFIRTTTNTLFSFVSRGDFTFDVRTMAKPAALPAFSGKWRVGDFNGDGKTDLFHVGAVDGQFGVYFSEGGSTGTNFTATTFPKPAGYPATQGGWWFTLEFNGDNRTDLYHVAPDGTLRLWISRNSILSWTNKTINKPPNPYPTLYGGRWQSGDLDGDGRDDLIHIGGDDEAYTWHASGVSEHRLTSFETRLGGVTTVEYEPSSTWDNGYLPVGMVMQTTSEITRNDGRGNTHSVEYQYEGGNWSAAERCFLGFQRVKKILDAAGNYEETIALQSESCATRAEFIYQRDAEDQVYTFTEIDYDEQTETAPFWVLETGRWSYECNLDEFCFRTRETRAYDAYGNVTQIVEHGDVDGVGDERTTTRQFFPNTVEYVVDKVAREVVTAGTTGSGTLLAETRNFYDDIVTWESASVRGELTKRSEWNDVTGFFRNRNFGYDTWGNVWLESDWRGFNTTTTFDTTYHIFPQQICQPLLSPCTIQGWDTVLGVRTAVVDSNGAATLDDYDVLGRQIETTHPDLTVTQYQYLDIGNPLLQRIGTIQPDHTVDGLWSEASFDGFGRNWKVLREGGETQLTDYHEVSERVLRKSVWFEAPELPRYREYVYDGAKRVVEIDEPGTPFTTIAYGDGNATTTDPLGRQRTSYRDGYGRVRQVREKNGAASYDTFFEHDLLGNLVGVTDASLNSASFDYDSLGRLVTSCDFDRGCWAYAYDNGGNLLTSVDAKGQTATFTYDALSRKKTKLNQAGELTQWFYDQSGHGAGEGRLTSVTYPSGSESFSYDAMGLETEITRFVADAGWASVHQTHQFGRLSTIQYLGLETIAYGYDSEGYLASVSGYVDSMTRNARGQLTSMVYANGTTTALAYDNQYDLMSSISVTGSGGPIQQASYAYNDASQITTISSSTHPELNVSYAYDDLYRLTSVTRAGQGTPFQSFGYDPIGNMTAASELGAYVYGQLARPHAVSQAGGLRYAYDGNGNLTSATTRTPDCVQVGRLMSWDSENRLAWVSAQGKTTRYAYTADGQRNRKVGPDGAVAFYGTHLELQNPLTSEALLTKYIYAGPMLVAKNEGGAKHWYHQDHLSSTLALSNEAGALARKTEYEAFGEELASTGTASNPRGFGSHHRDDESHLLYMGARYYDPGLSRFTQPDSVVPEPDDPQSWNRYSYTRNNPVNRIDPTGHADISTAADVADRWQGMADQSEAALNDWVEGGGVLEVGAATATQTAIDLGSGMVDMLRLGQGAAEGGWRGFGTDALRATGLLGPVATGASAVARGLSAEIAAARTVAHEIAAAKAAVDAARKAAGARSAANANRLGKALASEQQVGEAGVVIAGKGSKTAFRQAETMAQRYGGTADDWAKKSSSSYTARDGAKFETHWAENLKTGDRAEFKTKFPE